MRKPLFLIITMGLLVSGCGRKPVGLLPPENATADAYPQVYPRPLPGESAPAATQQDEEARYKARPDPSLQ